MFTFQSLRPTWSQLATTSSHDRASFAEVRCRQLMLVPCYWHFLAITHDNLCYADDIILLATSEAELQELVDCLDRVSHKYSLLINVNNTKVMASDGIACRMLIQNELL